MAQDIMPTNLTANTIAATGVTSGQRIVIKVLNADGTVAQSLCDDAVPSGKAFTGSVMYSGTLA